MRKPRRTTESMSPSAADGPGDPGDHDDRGDRGDRGDPGDPGQVQSWPETGPGSVSRLGRRFWALCIDWLVCTALSLAVTRSQAWTILFFAAEDYVLTAVAGVTVGKLLLGLRVVKVHGGAIGPGWALVRTLLLVAVIPPLMQDEQRGLHDRAADTVVVMA